MTKSHEELAREAAKEIAAVIDHGMTDKDEVVSAEIILSAITEAVKGVTSHGLNKMMNLLGEERQRAIIAEEKVADLTQAVAEERVKVL